MAATKGAMAIAIACLLLAFPTFAQDSLQRENTVNRARLNAFITSSSLVYTGALVGLNELWYKNAPRQSFQFFNDNTEWNQVDKLGHFMSSFQIASVTQRCLRWSGVPKKKSDLFGALTGFITLAPIEVLDGYSARYGASSGDLIANAMGPLLFYSQQKLWDDIRIFPKFSYRNTRYAPLRPEILGDDLVSRVLKDYNGQTYWLSVDVDKFVRFPKGINLAIGYGAESMVFAREYQNLENGYQPYRQWYFSLDPDLTAIPTNSKTLKTILFFANMIKLPSPTVELYGSKVRFRTFGF